VNKLASNIRMLLERENELGLGKMIWDGENNLDWGK
jgi:hypothetical protein